MGVWASVTAGVSDRSRDLEKLRFSFKKSQFSSRGSGTLVDSHAINHLIKEFKDFRKARELR